MKKPWQIWLLFSLCLLAVLCAMSWLSLKTMRLDGLRETDRAETEMARREAELQERVSSALYRMDLKMLPFVAQEASRPQYLYQSFFNVAASLGLADSSVEQIETNEAGLKLASPLLFQNSDWVLLHFQIDADNKIRSPQFPENEQRMTAISDFQISEKTLEQTLTQIQMAQRMFDYHGLLQENIAIEQSQPVAASNAPQDPNIPLVTYNVPAVENFRNQLQNQALRPSVDNSSNKMFVQQSRGEQRVNDEFNNRRDSTQEFTQQNVLNNNYGYGNGIGYGNGVAFGNGNQMALANLAPQVGVESLQTVPMQPMWLKNNLILARRVNHDRGEVFQCCWLDWERIKIDLQAEVADLLPDIQFEAVTPDTKLKIGTALTTIPVQLVVDRPALLAGLAFETHMIAPKSGVTSSLLAAWCSLGLAAIASALLLHGVLRLSERRAAFVSAVTHELRTPLTTFRMYSEMLAAGMVPPEKQQQYANTLKVQADRLSHLVENVLLFARIERGSAKITNETVIVPDLLNRFRSRLEERAADSQMQLVIEIEQSCANLSVTTQPAAIEQILFNLVDNACKYAQSATDNRILVLVDKPMNRLRISVRDFGPGVKRTDRKRLFQPFQQSQVATANAIPGVGLGLALCKRMAISLGGRLFDKECHDGAWFILELPLKNDN